MIDTEGIRIASVLFPPPGDVVSREMCNEIDSLRKQLEQRMVTSDYWKAEHNSGNLIIAELRQQLAEYQKRGPTFEEWAQGWKAANETRFVTMDIPFAKEVWNAAKGEK